MAKRNSTSKPKEPKAQTPPLKKIEALEIDKLAPKKEDVQYVVFESNGSFFAAGKSKMKKENAQVLERKGYGKIVG